MRDILRSISGSAIWMLVMLTACTASKPKPDFDSPDPYARALAIEDAALQKDQNAIPDLIESLDSDDPAVRFAAIGALERITGETFGYRPYDPEWERQAAVDQWVSEYRNRGAADDVFTNDDAAADSPEPAHDSHEP